MTHPDGKTGDWEVVIGLEIHAQVTSQAKLFSGAATAFGAEPNTQVSLVDAAMPGMLPVLNRHSVEQAVKTGLGLNARINLHSVFERKNYFYADLPPGYQISQYLEPIVGEGTVVLDMPDGSTREIGIERLHLEQDAGKSLHDQHPSKSYIDLNRAGVTLMEIVSKPDLRSAEEAGIYLHKLRSILRYLGTCDGNMDQGSLRCDVNLSLRRPGDPLGTRSEMKNLNSIRFVQQAIEFEAKRQRQVLEAGGEVVQETRLFDSAKGVTRPMRTKEMAHDYRYFPDPDLLPLELDPAWIEQIKQDLPELPDAKKQRFIDDLALHRRPGPHRLRRRRAGGRPGDRGLLRDRGPGPRSQAGRQLGDRRGLRRAQQERTRVGPVAGRRRQIGRAPEPHRRQDHLRAHRQGRLRRHVGDRQGRGCHRRGKGPQADHRHGRDRGHRGPADRRQPGPGPTVQGRQREGAGLVRGPDHESHTRQGQPRRGEPAAP
jgi:hypothetical protein